MLNYINATFGDFDESPVTSEWIHPGHCDVGHHLRLQVHDFDATGRFDLHFDFNNGLFTSEERAAAIDQFLALLEGCLATPDAPINAIEMHSPAERDRSLARFNAPAASPLPDRTILELFTAQAIEKPEGVAIECAGQKQTFRELDQRANAVAARLMSHGNLDGRPVGICMRRCPEMVAAVLGILKAGGCFVPLDLRNPAIRNRRIVEDAPLTTILTPRESAEIISTFPESVSLICVDEIDSGGDPAPNMSPATLADTAYILYTSGSTGLPKGVAISHAGIADYITWAARTYVRGDAPRFPLFTSLAFDLTLTSLLLPLITGGTLVVYQEDSRPIDTTVLDVVADNQVDFIKLTPSHLEMVTKAGFPPDCALTRMIVGGEDFKTRLARSVHEQVGDGLEIYNEYGPTEAVVGCMIHRFDPVRDTGLSVPIGCPADHVEIFVMDQELRPMPLGVPGELCVARHGLACGYHGAAAETQNDRFVPHPFRQDATLYRTGDLARFHNPSSIEFLGRIDRQTKLSGFRVEPAELERALEAHGSIEAAVVTVRTAHATEVSATNATERRCKVCGIPSNYPNIRFDPEGVCHICNDYSAIEPAARAYFRPLSELESIFAESKRDHSGAEYDCMALLSGGKDSTYTLYRLVGMGLKVYAFTLDNGYLSPEAKANIRRVTESLGLNHEFGETAAMPAIFQDSLARFSNVCNGCFKTVYTLSMARAQQLGIPIVVTGLSRGQFFETRLTADLFRNNQFSPEQVDAAVHEARKSYHQVDDAVSQLLDVRAFRDGSVFRDVRVVDFYRYCDVSVGEVLRFLKDHGSWNRPSDTGRSTNCLINDVGIYIHQKERGYHNYALPYSWDVRMGHKTRDQAIQELEDEIDPSDVRRILAEIGYDEHRLSRQPDNSTLVAYYQARRELPVSELRSHLAAHVPSQLLPTHFVRLDKIPLNTNGKVDHTALPEPNAVAGSDSDPDFGGAGSTPTGPVEERIAKIWMETLQRARCDAETSFFAYGGASLQAMDVMVKICEAFEIQLPLQSLFQAPTIRKLAERVEEFVRKEIEGLTDAEAERVIAERLPPANSQ